jgi:hypothetical protein
MQTRTLPALCLALFAFAATAVGASAQMMPQPDTTNLLSSADVSQEQVQKAARIAASVQSSIRAQRMKLSKELRSKYGNPQDMDSTEKATVRKEIQRRQMKMRKQQVQMMQQEAQNEDMEPQMFRRIMRSAQQDSTLKKQIQKALQAEMKQQQSPMGPGQQ